jgi:hypothetical protein
MPKAVWPKQAQAAWCACSSIVRCSHRNCTADNNCPTQADRPCTVSDGKTPSNRQPILQLLLGLGHQHSVHAPSLAARGSNPAVTTTTATVCGTASVTQRKQLQRQQPSADCRGEQPYLSLHTARCGVVCCPAHKPAPTNLLQPLQHSMLAAAAVAAESAQPSPVHAAC